MVLIDSPTDLIATASRQTPKMDTMMERFGSPYEEEPSGILGQQTQFSSNDYDYQSSWQDIYLKGAYEKRVEDLEKFAQDKNYWASASLKDNEDIQYLQGSGETGRRQRFRPFGRPLRRRPVANRRKETSDYEKENGIYDYVDPLSISNIWSSSSTTSEDVHPHKVFPPGYIRPEDRPNEWPNQDGNGLTRRVASAIFNPLTETIFTIVAIPLIIAAVYWLFVVNGPTPVVKARIEDMPLEDEDQEKFDWEIFDLAKVGWDRLLLKALKVFVPVTKNE